jgi:hypothetical protein
MLKYLSHYAPGGDRNRRLFSADADTLTFGYKDYADGARRKTMTLALAEFVRRFCLHLLPERFVKIRHYGLLGNRQRHERLQRARSLLGVSGPTPVLEPEPQNPSTSQTPAHGCCPFCHQPTLVLLRQIPPVRHVPSLPVLDSS